MCIFTSAEITSFIFEKNTTMNAIEKISAELEMILSDICFSGVRNMSPSLLKKLETYQHAMEEMGMKTGAKLILDAVDSVIKLQSGETTLENTVRAICTLDFYIKTIQGNMNAHLK